MSIAERTDNSDIASSDDMLQQYLQLQQTGYAPTAVDDFSQWHNEAETADGVTPDDIRADLAPEHEHSQAKHYRELIPVGMPEEGEQFAFEVDLAACSGCKSCVAACHSLNGLEDEELWREVGMLQSNVELEDEPLPIAVDTAIPSQSNSLAVIQHVTSACHHCDDPGCMKGCPVKAYEKDPITGIVRHLDDQCIGCQYCTLMCPYEVPKYSKEMGIVRKCDMCHQRLAVGQAPACVQACPNEAIRISIVSREDILDRASNEQFLPDSPPSSITAPSTVYKNTELLATSASRADVSIDKPQHSHFPLAAMLVATQLSVGLFLVDRLLACLPASPESVASFSDASLSTPQVGFRIVALFITLAGIHIAPLHLGRPMYAFRAFLNFKTSWLSREIIVFGKHMGAASMYVGASVVSWLGYFDVPPAVIAALGWATVLTGLAGLCCSVMVYVATKRPAWSASLTYRKFLLSSLALGPAFAALIAMGWNMVASEQPIGNTTLTMLTVLAVSGIASKLTNDMIFLTHLNDPQDSMLKRTALLMRNQLKFVTVLRFGLSGLAMCLISIAWWLCAADSPIGMIALPTTAVALLIGGELAERWLFFTSVIPFRMPGIQS